MFNAFHHYGHIMEVVIPAKRDKGGKRFGFTRFDLVDDKREFEYMLDNIIIGRDKISVNVSRFHRTDRSKLINNQPVKNISGTNSRNGQKQQKQHHQNKAADENTYAQVLRTG
ncbi:hypothetical protein TSUD_129780 [Trifolium subterraneum]|uniref:RRM domain-containing protein n=1 Tax=Trifolium subterraneum TaxID=3900 RepID=A0A2Z6LV66_TRISU|nr:hypothetical protein TSUD_129780 [Trifolium subterraneum]